MLLVEYSILDNVKVINESKNGVTKLKLLGKFQKCDEQNNNGRVYPRSILESQVKAIQGKIDERSLVGALDHPANDAIHLSQASHLITKLWVEKNGDVMGEAEILSTPNGKIVEALIGDGVKIGISSRGLGSVSENSEGKIVNEDFKLITFDLVSDPSTKGAFPEMCESMRENSQRAQTIISKHKKDRVLMTMLESKIKEALSESEGMVFGPDPYAHRTRAGGGSGGLHSRPRDLTPKDKAPAEKAGPSKEDKERARAEFKLDKKNNPPKNGPRRTQSRAEYVNDKPFVSDREDEGAGWDAVKSGARMAGKVIKGAPKAIKKAASGARKVAKGAVHGTAKVLGAAVDAPEHIKGAMRGAAKKVKDTATQGFNAGRFKESSTNLRNSIVDRLKSVYDSKMNEGESDNRATQGRTHSFRGTTVKGNDLKDREAQRAANPPKRRGKFKNVDIDNQKKIIDDGGEEDFRGLQTRDDSSTNLRNSIVDRLKSVYEVNSPNQHARNVGPTDGSPRRHGEEFDADQTLAADGRANRQRAIKKATNNLTPAQQDIKRSQRMQRTIVNNERLRRAQGGAGRDQSRR